MKTDSTVPSHSKTTSSDQLWHTDSTAFKLGIRPMYLSVVVDDFTRNVVGYSVSDTMDKRLTLAALEHACETRHPKPGLVLRVDSSPEYAASEYRQQLASHGIVVSKFNTDSKAVVEKVMRRLTTRVLDMTGDLHNLRRRLMKVVATDDKQ